MSRPPAWPKPAGRTDMVVVPQVNRAAQLEAQAAALANEMAQELIESLEACAAQALEIATLRSFSPAFSEMAKKTAADLKARAGSLRQLATS